MLQAQVSEKRTPDDYDGCNLWLMCWIILMNIILRNATEEMHA